MFTRQEPTRLRMACVGSVLLLGVTASQAETVIFSGNTASGIEDLNVNGTLYDVEFIRNTAYSIYGNPPSFDFEIQSDAIAATNAVRAALNSVPAVTEVSPAKRPRFTIGYKEDDSIFPLTVGWSGTYKDGFWQDSGLQAEPPFDSHTYAKFTVAGVDLTGTVEDAGGTPLCAMVLASGRFMFTCNPNGPFSLLDLPHEIDGTVKRQVYVDGFFPNVEKLAGSVDENVVMKRANNCPDYNSFPQPGVFPGSAGKIIYIAGKVLLQDSQTPLCAMVLANGQYMFSCDGTGNYRLRIPLDNNGQFKLQVYADGFAPWIGKFDEFKTTNNVRMARAAECQ